MDAYSCFLCILDRKEIYGYNDIFTGIISSRSLSVISKE